MQLTCPCCAARYPIEAALTDEAARQAVATALRLPAPLGDLLLRYLGLFRPPKRALAWDRVGRLLDELLTAMETGHVVRKGRTFPVPMSAWINALEEILARRDKLDLPLANHGYLLEVVIGIAAREGERKAAQSRPLHASHRPAGAAAGPRSMAEVVSAKRRAEWDRQLGIGGKDDG